MPAHRAPLMSKSWTGGSTRSWRITRAAVLARDGHRCQLRLDGCTTVATQAHHLLGREVAGDDPEHLVASCASCNLRTGNPRAADPKPTPRTRW